MSDDLTKLAIDQALKCKWQDAIKTNEKILDENTEDIDALNRISKAYFELGNTKKAKSTSLKVLLIDPYNSIATKSLDRYKLDKSSRTKTGNLSVSNFIEEPGKTKITTLINLGSEKIYSNLNIGSEVQLVTHAHKVSVTTTNNKYIGKLADDLSARLRILIKAGNKYRVFIKSISKKTVKVFIKGQIISFPLDKSESLSEFGSKLK